MSTPENLEQLLLNNPSLNKVAVYKQLVANGMLTNVGKQAKDFLDKHGFDNLEFLASGRGSLVFSDSVNPNLVVRLCIVKPSTVRPEIPQMAQAIHRVQFGEYEELPLVKIEFLRRADRNLNEHAHLVPAYQQEIQACGYELDGSDLYKDIGVYAYPDPENPRKTRKLVMGLDDSMYVHSTTTNKPPTCTGNYPTLEDQWRENCKLVEAEPRLKQMIGGLPPRPPTTQVKDTRTMDGKSA